MNRSRVRFSQVAAPVRNGAGAHDPAPRPVGVWFLGSVSGFSTGGHLTLCDCNKDHLKLPSPHESELQQAIRVSPTGWSAVSRCPRSAVNTARLAIARVKAWSCVSRAAARSSKLFPCPTSKLRSRPLRRPCLPPELGTRAKKPGISVKKHERMWSIVKGFRYF